MECGSSGNPRKMNKLTKMGRYDSYTILLAIEWLNNRTARLLGLPGVWNTRTARSVCTARSVWNTRTARIARLGRVGRIGEIGRIRIRRFLFCSFSDSFCN